MKWINHTALKLTSKLSLAMLAAGALAACGPVGRTVDDTRLEPDREQRVLAITQTACDRFESCGNIGNDEAFETYEECLAQQEDNFRDLWPADECGNGQIDTSMYKDCDARAESYPCDSNIFDFLSYYSQCNADDVCIDPAQ